MQFACGDEKLRKAARAEKNVMVRTEDYRFGRPQRFHLFPYEGVGPEQVVALFLLRIYEQQGIMRHDIATNDFAI